METFRAYLVEQTEEGFRAGLARLAEDRLPPGEVTVRVAYTSVNYKDGLATLPDGKVVRAYPMVPGIDLAGTVVASADPRFRPGQAVLATGYDLGVSHFGGYAELARLPADWLLPLPEGLTLREAMALGTAGFTAALAIARMQENGLTPGTGPVLVTGATGGVGSLAVNILAKLGYEVAASTGKAGEHEYLRRLGAAAVLDRAETTGPGRPLEKARWAGAVDTVGAATLPYVLRTTRPWGTVALLGNAGGAAFETTVFPFILRGVSLLGIDSAYCPMERRRELWRRLAGEWKPPALDLIASEEVDLDGLPDALGRILRGGLRGRVVVRLGG
ncbi:MAG: oxidoreductase [Firmicutes bacterium]|nr:oxidoreductase [Bacillota bacterium]